jgi:hypothetical protein
MAGKDLTIRRGSPFRLVIRVEQPRAVYVPISAIDKTAPVRLHATAHGLTDGRRFLVTGAKGLVALNAKNTPPRVTDYHTAKVVDPDTIEVNAINTINLADYTGGGVLQYNAPLDMTGYEIRMQARASEKSATVILEASTTDGKIVMQPDGMSAMLTLPEALTAAITAASAVYDVEFVAPDGSVPIATPQAKINFVGEVTRG